MTRRDVLLSMGLGLLCRGARADSDPLSLDAAAKLTVQVDDEFGPLRVALVHDASNARDLDLDEIVDMHVIAEGRGQRHPEAGPVLGPMVAREVARFRKLLAEFRVEMIAPLAIEGAASQIFMRDPLFVIGKTAYLGSLLDEHRAIELEGIEPIARRLPKVTDLASEGAVIEGGDVMILDGGKVVLVGTNANTNAAGFQALAEHLSGSGTRVVRIPHHRLHLDCCLAPLPNGSALIHGRGLSRKSVPILKEFFRELIPIDPDEANRSLAANLLWLDRRNVVSGIQAKKTNDRLKALGYTVHALDFTNVKRMWGSFRCAVCPIHRG